MYCKYNCMPEQCQRQTRGLIKALSDKPGTRLDQWSITTFVSICLTFPVTLQPMQGEQAMMGFFCTEFQYTIYTGEVQCATTNASRPWSDVVIHLLHLLTTQFIFSSRKKIHDKRVSLVRLKKSGAVTTSFWGRSITFVFAAALCKNLPPLHHRTNKMTYYTFIPSSR